MELIQAKLKELENNQPSDFYESLYHEQQINYWKRQLAHYEKKLKENPNYF